MATEGVAKLPAFRPAHPGAILREDVLPGLDMPLSRVAVHLGVSRQTLYDIINEKRGVTADIAARLGRAFGNSALFWLNLQSQHDAWSAERSKDVRHITRIEHAAAALRAR
jgi:addiction module HigA family antidote